MVNPQFKQHDVESLGKHLYEREQKLAQLKRQRERGEQQQLRSLLPPTPPTALEPDIGNLGGTEAQIIGYTSGDFPNFPGCNLGFNFFENLDMADIAHIESLNKIQPHPKLWSPRTPLLGHPTELTSQKEANPLVEDLPVPPGLVSDQYRIYELGTDNYYSVVEDEQMSNSAQTRKSCDADGLANDEIISSHDDDTRDETCNEQSAVPRPKLAVQGSSGIPASQILSRSNSATPDSMTSPSSATRPTPSFSIDAPAAPFDRVEQPETDVALSTPSSDHASVSRQGGDASSRGKRGRGAIEDGCESHDPRSPKRRSRDADSGTASLAQPARTLRALPSRQRQRPSIMTEITSPLLDHSSGKTALESSERVPFSPVAAAADPSPLACQTCGFSANHLLRMSDTVQALAGSGTDLSGSQKGLDMLHLVIGFVRDYATRLPHNATSTGKGDLGGIMNRDHAVEAAIGPSNAETVENDEGSDDSDDDGNSESDSGSSDHSDNPDIPDEKFKRPQRLRWEPLDERKTEKANTEDDETNTLTDALAGLNIQSDNVNTTKYQERDATIELKTLRT
ncbi:hypothetical protein F5883DRAFT_654468 [Diaporthe sp. PMI_573]|nr:hypothetical protein F5883DRAFT_654468 [Diaporthaceae sp. PMI_573]